MAKFCEACPYRGDCTGDIETIRVTSSRTYGTISQDGRTATLTAEYGVPQGPTDIAFQYVDSKRGASEQLMVHGDSVSDAQSNVSGFVNKIERCKNPTETKKFFGLVTRTQCAAPEA